MSPLPSPDPDEVLSLEMHFDPESVLDRDSRILLSPAFLATLHSELAEELTPAQSAAALLQIGFLHGLQDVSRAVVSTAELRGAEVGGALAPPLTMRCWPRPSDGVSGSVIVEGCWPDALEVSAHLSILGRDREVVCFLSAGYTSGWLSGAFGANLLAVESECGASGAATCRFVAREVEDWRELGDPRAAPWLDAVPFEAFRTLVARRSGRGTSSIVCDEMPPVGAMERDAAAVHIWGPVMVLPYAGPDETLRALELLGRDPGAADVSVIVVDLAGAIVDEAFGALALEHLVQTAETWAAETLFAEPSPLSERVIAQLDHPPLLVLKDLDHAVALAFQIARSQRRLA